MSKYSKLIAAIVGLAVVVIGPDVLGVTEGELDGGTIMQAITALATAVGVWAVPNSE